MRHCEKSLGKKKNFFFFWGIFLKRTLPFSLMRNEHRWVEPFICTPRESKRPPQAQAARMRACRRRKPAWRTKWENAVKVTRYTKHPVWQRLKIPRAAKCPSFNDYCVFVDGSAVSEPSNWPHGKVVGSLQGYLIVKRLNFAGVGARAQSYAAVLSTNAWKVSRWYHN